MAHLITNTDQAFFARNLPAWHKLGIVPSSGVINVADLQREFGYPITKEPLITIYGEKTFTYCTVRTILNADGSTKERIILGDKLSESYKVLQNSQLIAHVIPLMDQGCMLETGLTLNQGRRIAILLRLPGDLVAGKDDHIARYILISNDHTGEQAARVGFTPIRVVCANTLSIAENDRGSALIRIRHEGEINIRMEQVIKLMDTANGQFLAYGDTVDLLAGTEINQADLDKYVKRVFFPKLDTMPANTDKERELIANEQAKLLKMQNQINAIFQTEKSIKDHVDTRGSMWGAYQSVNFYLNHVQAIGEERRLHNIGFGVGRLNDIKALNAAKQLALAAK